MLGEIRQRKRAFEAAVGVRDNAEREATALELAQNRRGRGVGTAPEHFRLREPQGAFDGQAEFILREAELRQKRHVKLRLECVGRAGAFDCEPRHGTHRQRLRAGKTFERKFAAKLFAQELVEARGVQVNERAAGIEEDGLQFRGQRTEDRGQRTEVGGQRNRGQRSESEVRGQSGCVREGDDEGSRAINVAAMPDAEKVNRILLNIHHVNDAVVAHAQPATIRPF